MGRRLVNKKLVQRSSGGCGWRCGGRTATACAGGQAVGSRGACGGWGAAGLAPPLRGHSRLAGGAGRGPHSHAQDPCTQLHSAKRKLVSPSTAGTRTATSVPCSLGDPTPSRWSRPVNICADARRGAGLAHTRVVEVGTPPPHLPQPTGSLA